jgi:hypothetical protein
MPSELRGTWEPGSHQSHGLGPRTAFKFYNGLPIEYSATLLASLSFVVALWCAR